MSPVLALLVSQLLAQPDPGAMHGRQRAESFCGGSKAAEQRVRKDAESRAQKAFPRLRVSARDCNCLELKCAKQLTELAAARLPGETEGIVFELALTVRQTSGEAESPVLAPVSGPDELSKMARALRSHPFVRQVFGQKKLFCRLATDANAGTAWVACSRADWDNEMLGMSSSEDVLRAKGDAVVLYSVLSPGREFDGAPRVGEWRLEGYAVASSRLPEDALGWSTAREQPLVRAFTQEHKAFRVEFFRWHHHFLIVREAAGSPKGATVRFEQARTWFALPGSIDAVREGTDYIRRWTPRR